MPKKIFVRNLKIFSVQYRWVAQAAVHGERPAHAGRVRQREHGWLRRRGGRRWVVASLYYLVLLVYNILPCVILCPYLCIYPSLYMVHAKHCRMHIQNIKYWGVFKCCRTWVSIFPQFLFIWWEYDSAWFYYFILPFGPKFSMTKKIVK